MNVYGKKNWKKYYGMLSADIIQANSICALLIEQAQMSI